MRKTSGSLAPCVTLPRVPECAILTLPLAQTPRYSIHAETSGAHTFGGARMGWKLSVSRPVAVPRLWRSNSTTSISPVLDVAGRWLVGTHLHTEAAASHQRALCLASSGSSASNSTL